MEDTVKKKEKKGIVQPYRIEIQMHLEVSPQRQICRLLH